MYHKATNVAFGSDSGSLEIGSRDGPLGLRFESIPLTTKIVCCL